MPVPPPVEEKEEREETDDESYSGDTEERERKRAAKKAPKLVTEEFKGTGEKLTVKDWREAFIKAAVDEMKREEEKEEKKHIFDLIAENLHLDRAAYDQRFNGWAERGEITNEIMADTMEAAKNAAEKARKDLHKKKEIEEKKDKMMEIRLTDLTLTTGDIRRAMVKAVERARIAHLEHRPLQVKKLCKEISSLPPWDDDREKRCGTRCKIIEDGDRIVRLEFEDESRSFWPKDAVVGGDNDLMAAIATELRVTLAHLMKTMRDFIGEGKVNQEEFQQWEQLAASKLRPFGGEAPKP